MTASVSVLLVDEDVEVLDITQTFLEREGDALSVTTIKSVTDALELVDEGTFDCVVSDFKMPEMDGVTFGQKVHERDPDMPFFLFTAREGPDIEDKLVDVDIAGYVQKGTGTEQYSELAEKIQAAVE
jgi:DNA-binding NtrC family response regulator